MSLFVKLLGGACRSTGLVAAGASLSLLAGCGGGGGGGTPPPPQPPVNQAPSFTSGASVTVPENTAGAAYQASAVDPEGAALTFSITGGADAARFTITAAGQLSFIAPPNFELPADSDGNNVYLVEIGASDGQVRSNLTVSVTVANSREGILVRRVGTGFTNPVAASAISETFLLVAEKNGAIYGFNSQTGLRQLLVQVDNVGATGVVAAVAAPDYFLKGRFFVMYTTATGFLVVQEYLRNPAGPTYPATTLFAVPAPQYDGGGWLGFASDGSLFIATGDAGGIGDPSGSAQDDGSRLGKIIRARPNPDPFAGAAPVYFLISTVAKGLHEPAGGAFTSGNLLIADRGQAFADEVDLFTPGPGVLNFGWPFKEGTRIVQGAAPSGLTDPVIEYSRAAGGIQGIVGGAVARTGLSSLNGNYVFADRSGAIFTVPTSALQNGKTLTLASLERRNLDFTPDAGAIGEPVAVVADEAGRVYVVDADGEIFRVDEG